MDNIHGYEEDLTAYLFRKLEEIPNIKIYGPKPTKDGKGRAALAAFNIEGIHGSDLSTLLDHEGGCYSFGTPLYSTLTPFI
jgi:cysteine desulfurase/selenocysteine lyase